MKYCLALLLVFSTGILHAKNQGQLYIDSLLKELPNAKEDTNKIKLVDNLSYTYYNINPDEGLKYGQMAMELSVKLKWEKGIALSHSELALNYETKSDHRTAIDHDLRSLAIYEHLGDKKSVAAIYANISLIYLALGDYPTSLEYNYKALNIYEGFNAKRSKAIVQENIGSNYFQQKKYAKAFEYYSYALVTNKQISDQAALARNYGNIGMILDANGKYTEALNNHFEALKTNKKIGSKRNIQVNLANIGIVYSHIHDYTNALKFQLQALQISEELGMKTAIAINLGNIGELYYTVATDTANKPTPNAIPISKKAAIIKAIDYLEKAISTCKEINFPAPMQEFSEYLSNAYYISANYKKAFDNYKQYTITKDSIFSLQTNLEISKLENKREIEIKDQQILIGQLKLKEKQNERLLYITGISLMVLLICIAVRLIYKYRISNRALLREKKELQASIEMNIQKIKKQTEVLEDIAHIQSHDVRGPVATILGLTAVFNKEDPVDPINKVALEGIATITEKLDEAIKAVIKKENSLKTD